MQYSGYYEHLWHARKKIEAAEQPQPVEQDPEMQTATEAMAEEATENSEEALLTDVAHMSNSVDAH